MLSIFVPQIMTIKTLGHPVISELRERSSVVSHSKQLTTGNYIEVLNSAASTRSRTGHGILALPPCIVSRRIAGTHNAWQGVSLWRTAADERGGGCHQDAALRKSVDTHSGKCTKHR